MKSMTWTRWVCLGLFLGALLVASDVAAKKGGNKPPRAPKIDPCAELTTFAPDFVFWRDTGNRKNPKTTIYVAESATGCEQKLIDFPLDDFYRIQNIKFSSVEDGNGFFGRVVWSGVALFTSGSDPDWTQGVDAYVWKLDFGINGSQVDLIDFEPVPVLQNGWFNDNTVMETIFWTLDLSPDTRSLVYVHTEYPDIDHYSQELRIVPDLDACAMVTCEFDTGYVLDSTGVITQQPFGPYFVFASWGPEGDSIAVKRRISDPDTPYGYRNAIQYFDLNALDPAAESHLIVSDPNIIARPVAGMIGDSVYLAVEKEFSVKTGGCEGIFITNLEECLASDQDCFTTPVFAGKFPSWTKDGKLIHAYDGWEPHGGCGLSAIGVWDPEDGSLKSILNGLSPDAASR